MVVAATSQKNNLGTLLFKLHISDFSTNNFSVSRWPKRAKAPPLKSIVNEINLTPRHQLLSTEELSG